MDNYIYKDGALWLKNKWTTRVRKVLGALILASSLTIHNVYDAPNVDNSWHHSYITYVVESNPKVQEKDARAIVFSALKWAWEFDLDPKLLLAIAKVESNYYKYAISSSGAYGLMQVIPVWHKDKILEARKVTGNPEVFNIDTNMYLGARIYKDCIKKYGNVNKALLCYSGQTPGYDKKVVQEYTRL